MQARGIKIWDRKATTSETEVSFLEPYLLPVVRIGKVHPFQAPGSHQLMEPGKDTVEGTIRPGVLEKLGRYLGRGLWRQSLFRRDESQLHVLIGSSNHLLQDI